MLQDHMIKLNIKTGKNYEYLMKDGLLANAGTLITTINPTAYIYKYLVIW